MSFHLMVYFTHQFYIRKFWNSLDSKPASFVTMKTSSMILSDVSLSCFPFLNKLVGTGCICFQNKWHMKRDMWNVTCDMWHMKSDSWQVGKANLISKFQLPSSYSFGEKVFWRYFLQRMTDTVSDLIIGWQRCKKV